MVLVEGFLVDTSPSPALGRSSGALRSGRRRPSQRAAANFRCQGIPTTPPIPQTGLIKVQTGLIKVQEGAAGGKEPGIACCKTKTGAKEPRNLENHRSVSVDLNLWPV